MLRPKVPLKLYNTETRQKEEVAPKNGHTIKMYTCGPTVYNYAHIGNFRTYVFEDLLRRTLEFLGFDVKQAMNITDVEDKTIGGAIEANTSLKLFTEKYIEAFFEDLKILNIQPVEFYPRATDYIPDMISLIEGLVARGIAYRNSEGSIYFSIEKFPSYGRLSHLNLGELKVGASERLGADEYEKENAADFVLWKAYDPARDGGIFWESPFGPGRPGWHIECSAMAMKLLGQTIDLHVGGVDNIFPHHENEIAQSEAYTCCRFVHHWVHAEHLLVDHKKMSKSLGNFYTLRDLLKKGYTGPQVRYMLMQAHYRTQLNFTMQGMDAAVATLQRLADFISRIKGILKEKIQSALDLILEKALPEHADKRHLHQKILSDLAEQKGRDILDLHTLSPILERALQSHSDHKAIIDKILTEMKDEKHRQLLSPILDRALKDAPHRGEIVKKVLKEVRDQRDRDILDPKSMGPILQRALPKQTEIVNSILITASEKREGVNERLEQALTAFTAHIADDLNISPALAILFDLIREINTLCDASKIGYVEAEAILDFLTRIDKVLGFLPLFDQPLEIPDELHRALQERERARSAKDWKEADKWRAFIHDRGYLIEDTPNGARLKKEQK